MQLPGVSCFVVNYASSLPGFLGTEPDFSDVLSFMINGRIVYLTGLLIPTLTSS